MKKKAASSISVSFLLIILSAITAPAAAPDWQWLNPQPQSNTLYGVWGSAGNNVFAVGENGTIMHYDGVEWKVESIGEFPTLYDIWGSSGDDIFAVGKNGTIVHFDGTRWTAVESGATETLKGVWGSSSTDVFAVGLLTTILHYDGVSWSRMNEGRGPEPVNNWSVTGSSATDVFLSCSDAMQIPGQSCGILHYDGVTWSQVPTGSFANFNGIWRSADGQIFAIYGDLIVHFDGTQWTDMEVSRLGTGAITALWGSSANDAFAAGTMLSPFGQTETNSILHFDGLSWNLQLAGFQETLYDFWGSSGSDVFAVGEGGRIYHYDGTVWSPMTGGFFSKSSISLYGAKSKTPIWGSSNNDLFSLATPDRIYHYDGEAWSQMSLPSVPTAHPLQQQAPQYVLKGIWGSSPTNVFAVGVVGLFPRDRCFPYTCSRFQWGVILNYNGVEWTEVYRTGTLRSINDIWGASEHDVFAVGDYGMILHFDGSAWRRMNSPVENGLKKVWGSSGSDVYAIQEIYGADKLLHYDGISWNTIDPFAALRPPFSLHPLSALWGRSASDVYAAGYGNILHFDGSSWSRINIPGQEQTMADFYFTAIWGTVNDLFLAKNDGVIFHYDGSTWTQADVGEPATLQAIWGNSASDLFAVGWVDMPTTVPAPPARPNTPDNPQVHLYHYDGAAWSRMNGGDFYAFGEMGLWGSSGTDVFAAGGADRILHFNGITWSDMLLPTPEIGFPPLQSPYRILNDIWGSSPTDVFVVGSTDGTATVLHYDGATWTETDTGVNGSFSKVRGISGSDVFATGDAGTFHYNGANWVRIGGAHLDIFVRSGTDVYALGQTGMLEHYTGNGWSQLGQAPPDVYGGYSYNALRLWASSEDDVYMIDDWRLFHKNGAAWDIIDTPFTYGLSAYDIWGSSEKDVFVAGYGAGSPPYTKSMIMHYDGRSWNLITTVTFPVEAELRIGPENDLYGIGPNGSILFSNRVQSPLVRDPNKWQHDFDCDGISDIGVYFDQTGTWYVNQSTLGSKEIQFGFSGTFPVSGDFDGDGAMDYGVYDPPNGMWYLIISGTGYIELPFGFAGTLPVTGDFDGDGKTDYGVYNPPTGMWYLMQTANGYREKQWGFAGTLPVTGDFNGDGVVDDGVYNPQTGMWHLLISGSGYVEFPFGFAGTFPVTGDFDGDGATDYGVYDPPNGMWYLMQTAQGFEKKQWGFAGTKAIH